MWHIICELINDCNIRSPWNFLNYILVIIAPVGISYYDSEALKIQPIFSETQETQLKNFY